MSKAIVRSIKNVTSGYSSAQVKVRNATSNDAWGPSGTEMNDIARLTQDDSEFFDIMDMIDRRLNDKGKNWRHVMKALTLLDYCLHTGSENVVLWSKDNLYIIKTLREFQFIDEEGRDQGANIRAKAKELTTLIQDDDRLRAERASRRHMRDRLDRPSLDSHEPREPRRRPRRGSSAANGDRSEEDLERALEESRLTAEEEERRRRANPDDAEALARALRLSKEEEEMRQQEKAQEIDLLFQDMQQPAPPVQQGVQYQQTGYYAQNPIDPYAFQQQQQQQQQQQYMPQQDQQQPLATGFLENAYSSPSMATPAQQPMATGYGFQHPQPTGYTIQTGNYFQTPTPPDIQQSQQQTGYDTNNPYSNTLQNQNQLPQQTYSSVAAAQPIMPTKTGSNNPFARTDSATALSQRQSQPSLNQLSSQQANEQDPTKAKLNALLATGEGIDTFGNAGDTRIPAQHTASAGFINSQGTGRLVNQATGTNPFGKPQQTGGFAYGQNGAPLSYAQNGFSQQQTGYNQQVYRNQPNQQVQNQQSQAFGQGPSLIDL